MKIIDGQQVPEVGDVWVRGKYKYHIRDVECFKEGFVFYINDNLIINYQPLDVFLKNWQYLGKSKADIDQLFEVQDD